MALVESQIVVRFAGGVETKEDRKGVLPGKLLALENAVFTKAVSLVKRYGHEDLGQALVGQETLMPPALALGSRGDELLALSADKLHSYVETPGAWIQGGEMRSVIVNHQPVLKTGSNQTFAEVAVNSGIALYGWEDSRGGVWYALLNDDTGRVLVSATQVNAAGTRPRCIALGSFLYLVYAMEAPHELRLLRFSLDAPTATPPEDVLITSLSPTVPSYDLALHTGFGGSAGDLGVLAWAQDTGGIGVAYIHSSGAVGSPGLSLPSPVNVTATVASAVSICAADAEFIALAWTDAANTVKHVTLGDVSLSPLHATQTLATEAAEPDQVTCAFDGADTLWVFYEVPGSEPQNARTEAVRTDAAGGGVSESWVQLGCGLGSKAFRHGDDSYVHLNHDSTLYRTYYTVRADGRLVVARLLSGLGNGLLTKSHLPSVYRSGADDAIYHWAAIYVTDVDTAEAVIFSESGIRRVQIDFDSDEAHRSAQIGDTTYIAGGLLHAYDGERVVEAEFHWGIDDVSAPTQGAPTGSGIADGTYGYVFVLENTLANGEIQRGPVSDPILVEVTGGPRRVTFQVPTYRLTAMPNARIAAFRSLDGDDSTYNRVSSFDPSTVGDVNSFIANDTTVDTVTFIDEMPDSELEEQDPLYTNGGILENDPLGGARLVAAGKNRLFVVDGDTIYFTQERARGFAVETSPGLRIRPEAYGGDTTGIAVMDDMLVIFKETAVYVVTGPGPFAVPEAGGGWSQPERVTSDVGCISPDSIGYTPQGVLFQSRKGIYLLGRDRQVVYIGAPVEAYNSQRVVATTLIEDRTQIRLLTDAGRTLLYDYERGQWSTFTNHEGQDAVTVGGVYHYLRTDGEIWRETAGEYADDNAQIRMALETAWLDIVGHRQGWMRTWWVHILGERKSAHRLRVRIAFDYEDGWTGDPIDIDVDEGRVEGNYGSGVYGDGPYGGAPDTAYAFSIHIGQECKSIRFRFEDIEDAADRGASFELTELILIGGVERSTHTPAEARTW